VSDVLAPPKEAPPKEVTREFARMLALLDFGVGVYRHTQFASFQTRSGRTALSQRTAAFPANG